MNYRLFVIAGLLALPCKGLAGDPPREWKELKAGGETYLDVRVSRSEPDGLRIIHRNGVAKVLFRDLPEDVRKAYNHDPSKASAYAEEEAIRKEEAEADAVSAMQQRTADTIKNQGRADEDKIRRDLDGKAVPVRMKAHQKSAIGLLGEIEVGRITHYEEKPGSMKDFPVVGYGEPISAVLSGGSASSGTMGDGKFTWSGKAWRIGNITYTTVLGVKRTVAHYTTDKDAVMVWLRGPVNDLKVQTPARSNQVKPATTKEEPFGPDISEEVKAAAAKKWPGNYRMQVYEIEKQTEAWQQLISWDVFIPGGLTRREWDELVENAMEKWPKEYNMQVYELERQLEALEKLGKTRK